jgi:formate hydrogenlyase subunit 3/multisubunit Na+/H+ antiporter MnhD subunit
MLTLLGLALAIPAALALLAAWPRAWRGVFLGCAAAMGLVAALSLAALLAGTRAAAELPLGPAGIPLRLALDPLSAWFLLIVAASSCLASIHALGSGEPPARTLPPYPLFLLGLMLVPLAGDLLTLLLGFELMSLASRALVAARHEEARERESARLYLAFAAFSGLCLLGAAALMAPRGLGFDELRTAPPEGWRAALLLVLVLLGAGSKAGLAPLHAWLPLAHPAAPSHVSAIMSGAMVKVALYVMLRFLFDLAGPAQPLWWGVPLLVLGAGTAFLGALRANAETDVKAILACSTIENVGLIVMAMGLALMFRGADLGALAALALAAALLHALAHSLFKTGLFLAAGAVLKGTGWREVDKLGGLARQAPVLGAAVLLLAASAAALPPLAGFAGEWLLLQALVSSWRVADMALQILGAAALAVAGMAVALGAAAMVRLYGLVFLGRPRTPRAAGLDEPLGAIRWSVLVPAGLAVLAGLFAAPLAELAEGALRVALGPAAQAPARGLSLGLREAGARYAPLWLLPLLALAAAGIVWAMRRRSPLPAARGPAWDCGYIAPPAHLPFGEPLTQPSAAGLGQPIRRMLGESTLAAREEVLPAPPGSTEPARHGLLWRDPSLPALLRPLAAWRVAASIQVERLRDLTARQCLALSFGTLVALLALLAWLERT